MISFNSILLTGGLKLNDVRLLRHKESGAHRGRTVYELWRDQRDVFDEYQTQHSEDKHRVLIASTHWASFVATPDDETMFVGIYRTQYLSPSSNSIVQPTTGKIWKPGEIFLYEVKPEAFLSEYIGRLYIEWGTAKRTWVQHASRQDKSIVEIKRDFHEDAFPGYLSFTSDLSRISALPVSWKSALSAASGAYVLTCPKTREMYVGSAYGEGGFLARWSQYALDGHGGNIQLRNRDRSNYQVAILEVAGSSATMQDVIAIESRWKDKLETRKMGLNSN